MSVSRSSHSPSKVGDEKQSAENDVLLVLHQAAERMHDDAEACGDPAGSFIPAVADWLDEAADHLEAHRDLGAFPEDATCPTAREGLECSVLGQAVKVARAYIIPPGSTDGGQP